MQREIGIRGSRKRLCPRQKLGCEAAFGGGVITQGGTAFQLRLGEMLSRQLPDARLTPVALPPDLGAAVFAAFRAGLDPKPFFAKLAELETA